MNGIEIPARIAKLPKDERGYPVPYFTGHIDGKPDLRTSDGRKVRECGARRLCGVCGEALGYWIAFITGPLGCENRYTSETPLHEECARYSLSICPHLSKPAAKATAPGVIPGGVEPAGLIRKRPARLGLYLTRDYEMVEVENGVGFRLAPAKTIEWFTP